LVEQIKQQARTLWLLLMPHRGGAGGKTVLTGDVGWNVT
jgi:hypothetical protein